MTYWAADLDRAGHLAKSGMDPIAFAPPLAALSHPFLLMLFHDVVGAAASPLAWPNILGSAIVLAGILVLPAVGLIAACRAGIQTSMRRLAYAAVVAPTLYVFLGVVQAMVGSPLPDEWAWCAIWLAATVWALVNRRGEPRCRTVSGSARWRMAHGISAGILCLYVFFHIANHLLGLLGPETHGAMMDIGRSVYRAALIEPVLVSLLLFQAVSGLCLAWRWSASAQDFHRTFQIASGVYLAVFILGHMNSVFLYARTYLGIPTDWNFATAAPTGLIHDPWNIRLLPHYALGVFLVLSHLVSGLRVVLIAHGAGPRSMNRLWLAGVVASATIAAAIIAGMCGVRV